jgi:uncharacterized damage-inducible protein DinB
VIDDFAKEHLHEHLRWAREALAWKLDGLSEYDIRRPLTSTGTSLLGLVKHCAVSESRYFGEVFGRPFPEPLPRWDDEAASDTEFWAAGHETREDIIGLYQRVQRHSDATIIALPLDAPGYVPWWREEVKLFSIMAHVLSDATRHAGHADILREQLDGATGVNAEIAARDNRDAGFWAARRATVEQAARAAAQCGGR